MNRFILISSVVFIGAVAGLKYVSISDKDTVTTIEATTKTPELVKVKRSQELAKLFENYGFDVDDIRMNKAYVPRIHLASLPADYKPSKTEDIQQKKDTFVQVLLPMILDVNQKILAERDNLQKIKTRLDRGGMLTAAESEWIDDMSAKYRVKSKDINELLIKVDAIPPSLALAQASVESGWLKSRAARELNSTFGHMRTLKDIEGFADLYSNVEAYMVNINRHAAYRDLRAYRADMRKKGTEVCSVKLADGLISYSERGKAYIRDIKKMIDQNKFQAFDKATLET